MKVLTHYNSPVISRKVETHSNNKTESSSVSSDEVACTRLLNKTCSTRSRGGK